MSKEDWKVVVPDDVRKQIDAMSPELIKAVADAIAKLSKNPYMGVPLSPGLLGWRWLRHKIMFLLYEIRRLYE